MVELHHFAIFVAALCGFNTSNVMVELVRCLREKKCDKRFNTSNVMVEPRIAPCSYYRHKGFNTSNVMVEQILQFLLTHIFFVFQYI